MTSLCVSMLCLCYKLFILHVAVPATHPRVHGFVRFSLLLSIVHDVRVTLTLIPLLFRLEVGPSSLHLLVCSACVSVCEFVRTCVCVRFVKLCVHVFVRAFVRLCVRAYV